MTRKGMVKKSDISELPGPSSAPFQLVKVNAQDELGWMYFTTGTDDIGMVTAEGMSIRFKEDDVRPMGLVAAGVNGIKLKADDYVIGSDVVKDGLFSICVTGSGKLWKIPTEELVLQGRYGQGTIMVRLGAGEQLIGSCIVDPGDNFLAHFHRLASKLLAVKGFTSNSRAKSTKQSIPLADGDSVIELTPFSDYDSYWQIALSPDKGKKKKKKSDQQSTLPGI